MADTPQPSASFALPGLPRLREAQVFGRRICYYDLGTGSPLVLVHGVGGDADQWAPCLRTLAAAHRVIAIDLPGFGRSDKPAIDYRVAGFVEFLDRFLATIGIAKASLLGHSLGGWIAATFATCFPDKVAKLILNDAAGIDEGAIEIPVDLNVSTRANMRRVLELMFHDQSLVTDPLVDFVYALHLERGDGHAIKSVLETLNAPCEKLDGKLAQIEAPTLILWGENDAVTPLAMAHAYHRGIAGSRIQTLAHCGHLPCLEKPDAFATAVTAFLGADR